MVKAMVTLSLWLLVGPVLADVVVLKSGKRFEIKGAYEIKGKNILFKDNQGELIQLPLSLIDEPASKKATEELAAKEEAKAAKVAPVNPPDSLEDIADKVSRTNSDGSARSVAISDDRLKDYNEVNSRDRDPRIKTGVASSPIAGSATNPGGDSQPSAQQKADPNYVKEAREKATAELTDLEGKIAQIDAEIDRLKDSIALNEAAALNDDQLGGGDESETNGEDEEDVNPYAAEMDRADAALEELSSKRAGLVAEADAIRKRARNQGVRVPQKKEEAPKKKRSSEPGMRSTDDTSGPDSDGAPYK